MKYKKILAIATSAALIVGCALPTFAQNATGSGLVEYDDSQAISYDSVTVPTMVTDNTYGFRLDPTNLMTQFGAADYDASATVYFPSIKERAYITGETGITLYTDSYAVQTPTSGKWSGVVTDIDDTDPDNLAYTVAANYYVWTPGTDYSGTGSSGKNGQYTAITESNVTDYFEVADDKSISLRADYKAEPNVCDGNLYLRTITAAADSNSDNKIVDSDATPLSTYYVPAEGGDPTIKGVYKDANGTAATKADIKYVAAKIEYKGESNVAYATNKSTKKKTLEVTVTLNNTEGLTIRNSSTFASDDKEASVYFAAMNGSTAVPLADVSGVIKASFSVDLNPATDAGETLYQSTTINSKTGGHTYKRFSGPNPTYTNHSFKIVAAANKKTDEVTQKAWKDYGDSITGESKRPSLSIVYSLSDYSDAYTVSFNAMGGSNVDSQSVTAGEAATQPTAPTKAGKNFGGWYTSEDDGVTLSNTAFDFETLIDGDVTLYAKWNDPIEANNYWDDSINGWYISKDGTNGFDSDNLTSATIDDESVASLMAIDGDKWIALEYSGAAKTKYEADKKTLLFSIGDTYYTTELE